MILMYHKIYPEAPTVWWVTPNAFRRQMEQLQRYEVVPLAAYDPLNPRHVVITFDGVYENVVTFALPILKAYGYPFELFVVGATIGKGDEFDQPVEPPARFASADQLRTLAKSGGRLQWHSNTHRDLSAESDEALLEQELSVPEHVRKLDPEGFTWFAYPHGRHGQRAVEMTRRRFSGALSCVEGNDHDRYQLNRVTVTNDTSFNKSTVSLIIPNFNYGHLLEEAIESALAQTVPAEEILLIDDCSTDNSMEVAKRYRRSLRIERNIRNLGIVDNFKKAVSLTKGDYVCFLGADNRFRSDYVEKCKLALDRCPDAAIAYTNALIFGPMADVWARRFGAREFPGMRNCFLWEVPGFSEEVRQNLARQNVMHGSSMYRRVAYEEVGGYRASGGPEDQNLFVRILGKGWSAVHCADALLEYRQHSNRQDCSQPLLAGEIASLRRELKEKEMRIQKLSSTLSELSASGCRPGHAQKAVHREVPGRRTSGYASERHPFDVRALAFYLPQFHPIPENDRWWGKGFTEWTNVAKARPLFEGHYQPHLPADLGFYDLRLPEVRQAQADLARAHGIYGFCYYHYWFKGKRLLNLPLDEILATGEPDFPFCLCWANEDWTRRWDGKSSDVLMAQRYSEDDDLEHIRFLSKVFTDRRYIRVDGKPLFLTYRASQVPNPLKTTDLWRSEAARLGVGELYLCRVERFREDMCDPSVLGFDASVEFQPDGVNLPAPRRSGPPSNCSIYRYEDLVRAALAKPEQAYRYYHCVAPMWDNTARGPQGSTVFTDSRPELYEFWLGESIRRLDSTNPDHRLVFINAMNEWAEGCHLEPDQKSGRAYLEATKRALASAGRHARSGGMPVLGEVAASESAASCRVSLREKALPQVSIIIPVFNKVELTRKCYEKLSQNTPEGLYEVVIVDNASSDETGAFLKTLPGEVKIISNSENHGFAKACNQGARVAACPYLLFLNNDTEPQTGWLEPLLDVLDRDSSVAAVGSKLLFPDGTIQHAGVIVIENRKTHEPLTAIHNHYGKPSDHPPANQMLTYRVLTAASLLVRRKAFEAGGGFDEGYWNGYEDVDLCFGLHRGGWRLVYQPASVLIHHESQSGPERFRKVHHNTARLCEKWVGKVEPDLVIEADGSAKQSTRRTILPYVMPAGQPCVRDRVRRPQSKNLVSIVILTINERSYTQRCVESIRAHTPEPHEIIFVDNGSTDGTVKWLRKLVKSNAHYRLVENGKNLGFAKGCNQGIEASSGEYVLLLNNDVIVTPEWLTGLLECLNSVPDVGIVGPMTNNISGGQRVAGARYDVPSGLNAYAAAFRESHRHRRIPQRRIVGFCMLFRRELADRIGVLDESFGTGNFEDDDFCLRAAIAGSRNMIAGDVFIHHYGSRSFIGNRIDYRAMMAENRGIFDSKWSGKGLRPSEARRVFALKTLQKAEELLWAGLSEEAADALLQGMRRLPGDRGLCHGLAELLIETKEHTQALEMLKELPDDPSDAKAALLAGCCSDELGRLDEAEACADRLLANECFHAAACNLKGMVAYRRGDKETAVSFFRKAVEADRGHGEPHTNLGVMAWVEGRHEEALASFERGFVLSPVLGDVVTLYHSAVTALGAYGRAEEGFREAAALYPGHRRVCFFLIDVLLRQEKYAEAMDEIERALHTFGTDDGTLDAALRVRERVGPHRTSGKNNGRSTLSLCMIVKDEEQHLGRCLSSVKAIVDEIIVVDTGSTDRTRDIALAYGAHVHDHPWADDFSEARNVSLKRATGDWILVLDADEVVAESDLARLRDLVAGTKGKHAAYEFVTRNYVQPMNATGWVSNRGEYAAQEAGTGWYPSRKTRLFARDSRIRFENPVHEFVEPSLKRAGVEVRKCGVPVHHYGKLDHEKNAAKGERYYALGKKKLTGRTTDLKALAELATQAAELGKYDDALDLWEKVVGQDPENATWLLNLTHAALQVGKYDRALTASRKAVAGEPLLKEAVLNCAVSELLAGEPAQAASLLRELHRREPDYHLASAALSVALALTGDTCSASEYLEELGGTGFDQRKYLDPLVSRLALVGRGENILAVMRNRTPESDAVKSDVEEVTLSVMPR